MVKHCDWIRNHAKYFSWSGSPFSFFHVIQRGRKKKVLFKKETFPQLYDLLISLGWSYNKAIIRLIAAANTFSKLTCKLNENVCWKKDITDIRLCFKEAGGVRPSGYKNSNQDVLFFILFTTSISIQLKTFIVLRKWNMIVWLSVFQKRTVVGLWTDLAVIIFRAQMTYWWTSKIGILLDFLSTKRGLPLVDSWSHGLN